MPFEIVKPGTRIDFISKWRVAVALSVALLVAGALAIPLRGIQLGIEYGSEAGDDFVAGIEQRHAGVEFGDQHQFVPGVDVRRQAISLERLLVLALEREVLQRVIGPVADHHRFGAARPAVDPDSMWRLECAFPCRHPSCTSARRGCRSVRGGRRRRGRRSWSA